jgi:adenylate cyclase class IV
LAKGRATDRARTARGSGETAHVQLGQTFGLGTGVSPALSMASNREIEIKFRVADLRGLTRSLRASRLRRITPRTHEMNTLYDLPGLPLRKRGDLLRLRLYGKEWVLTHKAKGKVGRHKTRVETETKVSDGRKMEAILHALGFQPTFRYEKFRAEWADGKGHVVVDETPIGNFGEIGEDIGNKAVCLYYGHVCGIILRLETADAQSGFGDDISRGKWKRGPRKTLNRPGKRSRSHGD